MNNIRFICFLIAFVVLYAQSSMACPGCGADLDRDCQIYCGGKVQPCYKKCTRTGEEITKNCNVMISEFYVKTYISEEISINRIGCTTKEICEQSSDVEACLRSEQRGGGQFVKRCERIKQRCMKTSQ